MSLFSLYLHCLVLSYQMWHLFDKKGFLLYFSCFVDRVAIKEESIRNQLRKLSNGSMCYQVLAEFSCNISRSKVWKENHNLGCIIILWFFEHFLTKLNSTIELYTCFLLKPIYMLYTLVIFFNSNLVFNLECPIEALVSSLFKVDL